MEENIEQKKRSESNGLGIAGFVLALVSIFLSIFGIITAIIALIFCIIQIRRNRSGLAIAGLIISILVILLYGALLVIIYYLFQTSFVSDFRDEIDCLGLDGRLSIVEDGTCFDDKNIYVKIERSSDDFDLRGITFIFDEGKLNRDELINVLSPNEKKTYVFDYNGESSVGIGFIAVAGRHDGKSRLGRCSSSEIVLLKRC
jgi:hypothetical protein